MVEDAINESIIINCSFLCISIIKIATVIILHFSNEECCSFLILLWIKAIFFHEIIQVVNITLLLHLTFN